MLTLQTLLGNHRCCTSANAIKLPTVTCSRLLYFSFLLLFFSPVIAQGQTFNFSGTYPEFGKKYVDVPFTLSSHGIADITYEAGCGIQKSHLYLRTGDLADLGDIMNDWDNIVISQEEDPIRGYPLNQGAYIARIQCVSIDPTNPPTWHIRITTSLVDLSVPEDQEPSSMQSTVLTNSTSFSGLLGLWGTPDDPVFIQDNRTGHDVSDYKFYSLAKGTRIKFSATWKSITASTGWRSPAMGVKIALYRNGETYLVTSFDAMTNSGDETKEITLIEDGVYKISAVNISYGDPKQYRSYTMDVILNGKPVPGKLLVTVKGASWKKKQVRDYDDGYKTQRYLDISFDVENKYNKTQTIVNRASVVIPVVKDIPGETYHQQRETLINQHKSKGCQAGRIDWAEFCYGKSLQSGVCSYYIFRSNSSAVSSISPHSTKNYTLSIPVTSAQFYNFDESWQPVYVETMKTSPTAFESCYIHGISFWPVWAFLPAVNLLLRD